MKIASLLLAALCIAGCASQEDRALDARIAQMARDKQMADFRMQVDAYVANQCAYAKDDAIRYGDCNRQTRQFMYQQAQAENARLFDAASRAGAAQGAAAAQFIRPQPRSITCQSYGSGSQMTTTCN